MKLWVARHCYAGDQVDDPTKERNRPLLPAGVATAKAIAGAMGDAGEIPSVIFCSPYTRAVQTADIIGKVLVVKVSIVDDLSPNRPLEDRILEMVGHGEVKRMMILGHVDNTTPAFNNFATGKQKWDDLVMGEVRRLNFSRDDGCWVINWAVKPSDLGLKDYTG